MGTEENKELVRRFDEMFANRDIDALEELCTPDMINHALAASRPKGLDGTREFLRTDAPKFGNDDWTDSVVVAEGDFVVQFGVRAGEWGGGPFLGMPANPGPYAREVAFCYRIEEGKIAERWAMRDDLTMLRQLGTLPPR